MSDWQLHVNTAEFFAIRYRVWEHRIEFEVHAIAGVETDDKILYADERSDSSFDNMSHEPIEGGHYLHGTLKWDGCCDFAQSNHQLMIHSCDFNRPVPQIAKVFVAIAALGLHIPAWSP